MTTPLGESLRTDTSNWTDPTSQTTIAHINQVTVPGHNNWNNFPIGSLNGGIDVPRSGRNVDNRNGIILQVPIMTTIP